MKKLKRRFLAAALALCLALGLLPASALADETDSPEYWLDLSVEEARTVLHAVADESEGRYLVLVCYDASTAQNPIESQFRKYANEKGYYIYGCHTGGESLLDALAPLFGGNTALTLPVAVTWNPSTKTCMAKDNVRTMIDNPAAPEFNGLVTLMGANGLGHGSSVPDGADTPPSGPDDPELPPPADPDAGSGSSIVGVSEQAWEVLRLLNIYRMEKGLQPLSVFSAVQEAANIRAKELFTYCSHTRPDGRDYSTVFSETGLRLGDSVTSWAENIASGQKDAADVMNSWKWSPGHNANMIKPTGRVHVGIGYDYQTNGNPSLYASNWVQNFAAAYDCSFTNLQLSRYSLEGKPGTDLETLLKEAGIEVTASCYRHGKSSLPLIAAMCSGYDADSAATQELTVSYGGQTAVLTISAAGHTHTWDDGIITEEPTCTEPGRAVYTCVPCGASKTEAIPAAGHRFAEEDGVYVCEEGDAVVPSVWRAVYEEWTADTEENALRYPHGVEGIDLSAADASVRNYLGEQAEAVLRKNEIDEAVYACEILDGTFAAGHTRYEYRIGIRNLERAEAETVSLLHFDSSDGWMFVTEPLVLFLNFGAVDDSGSEETTDVVTPDGNVSVGNPSVPPEEPTPPRPPESHAPSRPSGSGGSAAASSYAVSAPKTTGGQVTFRPDSASRGQRVTVLAQPDSGFVLGTLRASDASGGDVPLRDLGGGTYEFTMPGSRVTVTAVFEKIPMEPEPAPLPFMDVSSGDWFYSGVDYVWKQAWMNGVSDTEFAPGRAVSRAMTWVILARMHTVSTDPEPGAAWYETGRLWAVRQGISDGTDPSELITRQQIASMLWRAAGSPAAATDLSGFEDSGLVSAYAQTAMCWAVENGIMQGNGGRLYPRDTASRAEMAVMLARYAA